MEYFYHQQSEMFSFYRIPKLLFTDEHLKTTSCDAKLLYGILLARMELSQKNRWLDKNGRVFVYYSIENIMESMGCAHGKAGRLLKELVDCGLLEKKRQGLGMPDWLYLKNIFAPKQV